MQHIKSTPTIAKERIGELDVFRGFAILGIFMVNILVMNVSFAFREAWEAEQTGWLEQTSFFVLQTVFYSKFFAIFSFLFGMGVALQIRKAKERENFRVSFFLRRFAALFVMGELHILLIWSGDILHLYAILGVLLLYFFQRSSKFLLWSAALIFLFPLYGAIYEWLNETVAWDYMKALMKYSREELMALKHDGSYWSGVELRTKEWAFAIVLMYFMIAPIALCMMLLGGVLVKKGFLENIPQWLERVKKTLFISFGLLMVYRFSFWYLVMPNSDIEHGSPLSIALVTLFQLSDMATSFVMLWGIAYLYQQNKWKKLLSPMRYVGQAALSNYIMQSVLGYIVMRTFNGYEYFSAFGCMILVLSIYLVQILLSKWWFSYFRFGPLEWLWRCVSYRKFLSIR